MSSSEPDIVSVDAGPVGAEHRTPAGGSIHFRADLGPIVGDRPHLLWWVVNAGVHPATPSTGSPTRASCPPLAAILARG